MSAEITPRRTQGLTIVAAGLGFLMIAIVALLSPVPVHGRTADAVSDMFHTPLFCAIALVVLVMLEQFRPLGDNLWRRLVRGCAVFLLVAAAGAGIELIQRRFGRAASIHDSVANAWGAMSAVLLYACWAIRRTQPARQLVAAGLLVGVLGCVAVAWWKPGAIVFDAIGIRVSFPLLASFESAEQLGRFRYHRCTASRSRRNVSEGNYAMELSYESGGHPHASLVELQPDWSKMNTLELDVTLDADYSHGSLPFYVEVKDHQCNDKSGDAFLGQYTLIPGQTQQIRVTRDQLVEGPQSRSTELASIRSINLALARAPSSAVIRVDNIRLTLH